ncbi:hypothetical protein OAP32_00595 [Crocinitomicaceae bacterium]|nr:hypothetical protein [Crocinitomicaceae bacterium]
MTLVCNNPSGLLKRSQHLVGATLTAIGFSANELRSLLTEVSEGLALLTNTAYAVKDLTIEPVNVPANKVIHQTLVRVSVYLAAYIECHGEDKLALKLSELSKYPKPWTASVAKRTNPTVNKRGVRDFNAGGLVGGHSTVNPTTTSSAPVVLDDIEAFSRELLILESLLPLYQENT